MSFVWIAVCVIVYLVTLSFFPTDRRIMLGMKDKIMSKFAKKRQKR